MAKLGDVCTIVSGTTPKSSCPEYWDGNINWVTPAELNDDSDVIYESQRKITEQAVRDSSLMPFPAGTVLLSSRAPIGKVAIAGVEMYCNQGFKNLICSNRIYNRYLYHFLKNSTKYLNSLGRGATFKEVSKSIVENIEIPLPPLDEQRRIVAVLDKISNLIAKRRQQLDKLDELVKVRFVEMFGDPVSNPQNWAKEVFSKNVTLLNGRAFKQEELQDSGKYPVLRVGNFFSNRGWYYSNLELDEDKYCDNGDLLYAWSASFGPQIWNGGKVIYHYHIWKVLIKDAYDKQFLCKLLDYVTQSLMTDAHGIAMMHLTKSGMEKTLFIVPPLKLQEKFSSFVRQIDKSKLTIRQSLDKLEVLKKALMQQYFR